VALQVACRGEGIDPADVVAIGDADNDIEMFRVAGGSFAMGQATDAVKAAAKAVTAANDQDGVALAIERLLAEGEAVFSR
jgi:hydroxymethylpyrimidine pyrophosphatase-like HAD family hydrolase